MVDQGWPSTQGEGHGLQDQVAIHEPHKNDNNKQKGN